MIKLFAPKVREFPLAILILLNAGRATVKVPLLAVAPILTAAPPITEMTSLVPLALVVVLLSVNVLAVVVPEAFASISMAPESLKLSVSAVKLLPRVVVAGKSVLLNRSASVVAGIAPELQSVPTFQFVPAVKVLFAAEAVWSSNTRRAIKIIRAWSRSDGIATFIDFGG